MIGKNGKLNPNATLGNLVTGRDGNQYYLTPDDWNDETYHTGLRQDYSVSASGSSDKGNYYASLNYLGNEGITTNSNYERITTRLKADYNLKSWLKLGANVSYTHDDSKYVDRSEGNGEGSSSAGNVFALQYLAPIYPVYMRDATGKILTHNESGIPAYDYGDATSGLGIARPYMGQSNPLSDMLVDTRKSLGNKRVEISDRCRDLIMEAYRDFTNWSYKSDDEALHVESKVLDNEYFKYSKLTIERPLTDEATGEPILKKGKLQPDTKKRDTEIVPWTEDIDEYMQKNVLPYAPDAWIDKKKTKIGYEIPFTREFYKYVAPRKSEDIFAHLKELETQEADLMAKILG